MRWGFPRRPLTCGRLDLRETESGYWSVPEVGSRSAADIVLRMCSSSSVRVRARAVPLLRSRFLSVPRSPLAVVPRLRPLAGEGPGACRAPGRLSGPTPSGRGAVRAGRRPPRARVPEPAGWARGAGRRRRRAAGSGPARPRPAGRRGSGGRFGPQEGRRP